MVLYLISQVMVLCLVSQFMVLFLKIKTTKSNYNNYKINRLREINTNYFANFKFSDNPLFKGGLRGILKYTRLFPTLTKYC